MVQGGKPALVNCSCWVEEHDRVVDKVVIEAWVQGYSTLVPVDYDKKIARHDSPQG